MTVRHNLLGRLLPHPRDFERDTRGKGTSHGRLPPDTATELVDRLLESRCRVDLCRHTLRLPPSAVVLLRPCQYIPHYDNHSKANLPNSECQQYHGASKAVSTEETWGLPLGLLPARLHNLCGGHPGVAFAERPSAPSTSTHRLPDELRD
jgi:hypothetical protein